MRENNWSEITQLITLSNATKAMQTYGLFVHGQRDVRAIHSATKDQRKAVIAIVRSVFGQQNGACMKLALPRMNYNLMLCQKLISNTFKFKHTQ